MYINLVLIITDQFVIDSWFIHTFKTVIIAFVVFIDLNVCENNSLTPYIITDIHCWYLPEYVWYCSIVQTQLLPALVVSCDCTTMRNNLFLSLYFLCNLNKASYLQESRNTDSTDSSGQAMTAFDLHYFKLGIMFSPGCMVMTLDGPLLSLLVLCESICLVSLSTSNVSDPLY